MKNSIVFKILIRKDELIEIFYEGMLLAIGIGQKAFEEWLWSSIKPDYALGSARGFRQWALGF